MLNKYYWTYNDEISNNGIVTIDQIIKTYNELKNDGQIENYINSIDDYIWHSLYINNGELYTLEQAIKEYEYMLPLVKMRAIEENDYTEYNYIKTVIATLKEKTKDNIYKS